VTWRLELDTDVACVPRARHWLMRVCRDHTVDDDLWDLLALLSTELVANAVLHGAAPAELTVTVTGTAATGIGVVVTCSDGSPQLPTVQDVQVEATGGRGVALIDMLASAWGAQAQDGGKSVWFRLDSTRDAA